MWRDDYLLHCNMQYIIVAGIEFFHVYIDNLEQQRHTFT